MLCVSCVSCFVNAFNNALHEFPFPLMNVTHATQSQAVAEVLHGGDVLLASHTGSGKTLAYLLPLVRDAFSDFLTDWLFNTRLF